MPSAQDGARFTALFATLAIDWLRGTSHRTVAVILGLTWDQIDGIFQRALRPGLRRRQHSRMHYLAAHGTRRSFARGE